MFGRNSPNVLSELEDERQCDNERWCGRDGCEVTDVPTLFSFLLCMLLNFCLVLFLPIAPSARRSTLDARRVRFITGNNSPGPDATLVTGFVRPLFLVLVLALAPPTVVPPTVIFSSCLNSTGWTLPAHSIPLQHRRQLVHEDISMA